MNDTRSITKSGLSQDRLSRLSKVLQGYVDRKEIAGISALIHRHDEEAYFKNFGFQDMETHTPINRRTLFRIASMTKPITAACILSLVEEGKIRLFDKVDDLLPELSNRMVMRDPNGSLQDVSPSLRSITLHDLLTFRMGIGWGQSSMREELVAMTTPPAGVALQIGSESLTPDAWMARLGKFPLLELPGERWRYQIAFDVLGVLIARVTGKSLEAVFSERIFEPLKMRDTSFSVPQDKLKRLATLYAQATDGLVVRDHPQNTLWEKQPLFASGAGGLISSIDDFQRFGRMLLNKGALEGVRILSRKAVEAMTTDYLTKEQHTHKSFMFDRVDLDPSAGPWDNYGFGYGVAVKTRRLGFGPNVGSFYWQGAFGTSWVADPEEGIMATLMLQAIGKNPFYTQVNEDFLQLTYQAISD